MADSMKDDVPIAHERRDAEAVTDDLGALISKGLRFACIYADPAWQYGNQATRASTDNHYQTMSVSQMCDLPITRLSSEDAFLHLWTTNGFLFEAKRVMDAWGFAYKSCLVWVKPQMGIGNYWRVSHEFLLLGKRGNPKFQAKNIKSWQELPRSRHSQKPEAIRGLIERANKGPYLELFARQSVPGWTSWGNEVERTLQSGT